MPLRIDETVAHNLKVIRLRHHMTQQALADRANLSKQTISNLEKGQGATSKTLERLAECLDVSPLTFYQEISDTENVQFKRVTTSSTSKFSSASYVEKLTSVVDDIVFETKNKLYYEQLAPLIKDIFNNNTNILLNNLGVGNNSKNYHIIASLEETLLIEIKQSILGKSYNDMDTLLDEE